MHFIIPNIGFRVALQLQSISISIAISLDYDNVLHDSSAMHVFNAVFENLELIFGDRLPAIELLISIYGKILVNSFAVQDEMMEQIGRAIYLE